MERTNWWWVAVLILILGITIYDILFGTSRIAIFGTIIFFLNLHNIHEEVKEVKP